MKNPAITEQARPIWRDLFSKLSEGVTALAEARQGMRTRYENLVELESER